MIIKKKIPPYFVKFDWYSRRNSRIFLIASNRWMVFFRKTILNKVMELKKDITEDLLDWEILANSSKTYFKPVVLSSYASGASISYSFLKKNPISFDIFNVETIKTVDKICMDLVQNITNETKLVIRARISEGIRQGKPIKQVVNELRYFIGLNRKQASRLLDYKTKLLAKNPEMSLRLLNRRLKTLGDKLLNERLTTISQTETVRALNYGYVKTYEENNVNKFEFYASPTACVDQCVLLNGIVVRAEEAYTIIPVHPKCQCMLLPVLNR